MKKRKREKNKRVSEKISVLAHEGVEPEQRVAMALNMERSGRLRRGGRYVHKRRGRKTQ
jgi:hypothetical protein